jgi:3-oxoacyl-[acyl-carrier protein] reductase
VDASAHKRPEFSLSGSAALVTGASRGLGREVAFKLAEAGAKVAVNYCHDPEAGKRVADEIRGQYGVEALAVKADMGVEPEITAMIKRIWQEFNGLQVLVNNAAICPKGWVTATPTELWEQVMRINLTGPFIACREMLRRLLPSGKPGRIVNISSAAAFFASTSGQAAYDASKGGLNSLTMSLAREVSPRGITVNALAPGLLLTEMGGEKFLQNQDRYMERIPIKRFPETSEIADAVRFLCSKEASYINGTVMNVTGGFLLR